MSGAQGVARASVGARSGGSVCGSEGGLVAQLVGTERASSLAASWVLRRSGSLRPGLVLGEYEKCPCSHGTLGCALVRGLLLALKNAVLFFIDVRLFC